MARGLKTVPEVQETQVISGGSSQSGTRVRFEELSGHSSDLHISTASAVHLQELLLLFKQTI